MVITDPKRAVRARDEPLLVLEPVRRGREHDPRDVAADDDPEVGRPGIVRSNLYLSTRKR